MKQFVDKRVIAVIPAFNESSTIKNVIEIVKQYLDVLVVNDGSTDQTRDVAKKTGASVISNSKNLGYELSIEKGLQRAFELGYEYAITIDADGQHNPKDVRLFLKFINDGYQLVLGIRNNKARFSEKIFSYIFKRKWGPNDPLCGMKAYYLSCYMKNKPYDFKNTIATDVIIKLINSGIKYIEVKIKINQREDKPRFGGLLKSNYKILKASYFIAKKYNVKLKFNK